MNLKINKYERDNYVLREKRDLIILFKIRLLENKILSQKDKELVNLIKTQLKRDWRAPIIGYLNKLIIKYQK